MKYLPISNLADNIGTLCPGHVYAIFDQGDLWSDSLIKEMAFSKNVIICCEPQQLASVETLSIFSQAYSLDRVNITDGSDDETKYHPSILLQLPEQSYSHMQPVLKDLSYFGQTETDCFVFYSSSESWFSSSVKEQKTRLRQIKNWSEHSEVAVCLVFSNFSKVVAQQKLLHQYSLNFSGIVTIDGDENHGLWSLWHWYSPDGLVTQHNLKLFRKQNRLQVEEIPDTEAVIGKILDRDRVYCLKNVLFEDEAAPENWLLVADYQDLQQHLPQIEAAYIILPYNYQSSVAQLTEKVFKLRRQLGDKVKIIVREVAARMRHADERILTYFGASLVLPSTVSFSRLLSVLESIRNLRFSRHIGEDDAVDLKMVIEHQWVGYLQHQEFLVAARILKQLSSQYSVEVAFVELDLKQGVEPRHIIDISRFKRSGDICTVIGNKVVICLFGCRGTDVQRALTFIMGMDVASIAHVSQLDSNISYFEDRIHLSDKKHDEHNVHYSSSPNELKKLKDSQHQKQSDVSENWGNTQAAQQIDWAASSISEKTNFESGA